MSDGNSLVSATEPPPEESPAGVVQGDEPHKDYETKAGFARYDEQGNITEAGQQGVAFTTDAMARGERIVLCGIFWNQHRPTEFPYYVDLDKRRVVGKSACPATIDGEVLHNLPTPCQIEIREVDAIDVQPSIYSWTEVDCTLSFQHEGTYAVRVLSVPHMPGAFEVHHG